MVDFSKKELSELEALQVFGGSVNENTNTKCSGNGGTHYVCVNTDCSHGSCTHFDCQNTGCTHNNCVSKERPTINPGDIRYPECSCSNQTC